MTNSVTYNSCTWWKACMCVPGQARDFWVHPSCRCNSANLPSYSSRSIWTPRNSCEWWKWMISAKEAWMIYPWKSGPVVVCVVRDAARDSRCCTLATVTSDLILTSFNTKLLIWRVWHRNSSQPPLFLTCIKVLKPASALARSSRLCCTWRIAKRRVSRTTCVGYFQHPPLCLKSQANNVWK